MTTDNNQPAAITTHLNPAGIFTVTLNRPAVHNAFDDAIIADLTRAFEQAGELPGAKVLVLAAEGKSFSAGADLSWMQRMAGYSYQQNLTDASALAGMLKTLYELPIPTIARVQGAAFGGAVGLVSCCDVAVATEKASFCLSEVKIGLIPATISPYVIGAIGARAAKRYFVTAERFSAETAHRLGLVSDVVDASQLDATIDQIAQAIMANSPAAVKAAKKLILDVENKVIDQPLIDDTSERIASIRVSPEGQEGLAAFLEKRSPSWLSGTRS